jgi:hypothetical protein
MCAHLFKESAEVREECRQAIEPSHVEVVAVRELGGVEVVVGEVLDRSWINR